MKLGTINNVDISQVLDIYSAYIHTKITFENAVPDIGSFTKRVNDYTHKYPWLVLKIDDAIAGYAYASVYREREAYQWVAECSVYIHPDYKRMGIARKLYSALFEILKLQGIYKLYAVITLPNKESTNFHESMGFTWFATYQNVGYKLGQWCDVGWWQMELQIPAKTPLPPINYSLLNKNDVQNILEKHST